MIFHNFHKLVCAREQSPRMQMASLSHGLQRELIVIRTSSLELIGASERGGRTGRRKYSFEIDQSSEPKAFASIVRRCSDRLFPPLNSAFCLAPGVIYRRIVSESRQRSPYLFRNSDTLRANTHTKLKRKWTETRWNFVVSLRESSIPHLRESRSYAASEKDKGAGEGFLKYGTVGERATKVS